ncbi:iron ABC transporter permease [Corynebacterium sp.]|uniref:FecCD family ABC transporter permease n=1 Tax=Corynebacterium sp. TaxID=1720 RepID=UPI002648BAF2|nr:iron ABC transporter permease [Corynebacterium sp.]MDN5721508.1 iron ABC transporter permease [Corynebacterium sp.]MDN6281640.1 iron ABC transporter permease [Corynebacterium sp.]MDN6367331.1 iron ABC transporter permease [Corynebacterium sp.]MDN6374858.1 iron ABC transporter permease [Corynebacterium sp.]MDN6395945.1 iron ABC transporter permease [Corynebacterium sp.]
MVEHSSGEVRRGPWRPPAALVVLVGLVLLLCSVVAAVVWGSVPVPLTDVITAVREKIVDRSASPSNALDSTIVWQLRIPRVLAAALVGAALALAGAALQGLVRNPLADPYTLGISNGASLAAVATMSSSSALWLRNLGVPTAAGLGAVATLVIILYLSQRKGSLTGSRIVLAGVGVGQIAMAGTSLIQLKSEPGEIRGILFWMMGSVAGVQDFGQLLVPTVVVVIGTGWLLLHARNLNLLTMGDDDARALGVNVNALRLQLIVIIAALTGMAVAVAGGVGFIGLIVPHCVRFITGPDHRLVLPGCIVFGAVLLVLIDLGSRILDIPNEYPLTIFTAALGGPFFLWLLKRSRSGGMV